MAEYNVLVISPYENVRELYSRYGEDVPGLKVQSIGASADDALEISKLNRESGIDLIIADMCFKVADSLTAASKAAATGLPFALAGCEESSYPAIQRLMRAGALEYRPNLGVSNYWHDTPKWIEGLLSKLEGR